MTLINDNSPIDYLEHHGVKGMKWGVRRTPAELGHLVRSRALKASAALKSKNIEVMQRVSTASKAKVKSTASSIKKSINDKKEERAEEIAQKKADKEYAKKARKEFGMSTSEYNKLRQKTLKSHDPEEVAKGMHTLTDSELKEKVTRLKSENEIANLAQLRASNRLKNRKAKYETLTSNPLYKLAEGTVKDSLNELGLNTVVKSGVQPMLARRVERMNTLDNRKYSRKTEKQDQKDLDKRIRDGMRREAAQTRIENVRNARVRAKVNKQARIEANKLKQARMLDRRISDYRRTHPNRQRDPYQIF